MNTSFRRLVWKEHRAQRQLLVVLLLGCVCLYVLLRLQSAPWGMSLGLSSTICIFFVVAATAIAFAGEVDDRTVNLLRMLPCRTSTMITAKLTAIVTGCLALVLALAALSGVIELIGLAFPQYWRTSAGQLPSNGPWFVNFIASMLLLFACTLLASFLTRRVISAVGIAAIMFVAVLLLSGSVLSAFSGLYADDVSVIPWIFVCSLAIMTGSIALARPWHLGRIPPDWRTAQSEAARTRRSIPSFLPYGIAAIRRIVSGPASQRRIHATLFWRECRSAIPFAAIWLIIGIANCIYRATIGAYYAWPMLYLMVFMHECGQRTMRSDQRSGSLLMLANVGVSPGSIWFSKTMIWFSVMIGVGVVFVFLDTTASDILNNQTSNGLESGIVQLISTIRTPGMLDSDHVTRDVNTDDQWLQFGTSVAIVLLTFSIGQLTASWIRRQIIAYAASLLLLFGVAWLTMFCVASDYSVWIAVVPIAICFLLATRLTARQWIDGHVSWRLRLQQTAWLMIPFLFFPWSGSIAWYLEPFNSLSASIRYLSYGLDYRDLTGKDALGPLDEALAFPTSQWGQFNTTHEAQIWQRFARQLAASADFKTLLTPPAGGWPAARDAVIPIHALSNEQSDEAAELLQVFEEYSAKEGKWPLPPVSWTTPWSNTPAPSVVSLLLSDAGSREKRGDVVGAVNQHVRAIHLSRILANQTSSWQNWTACVTSEQVALDSLRQLLGSADLSDVKLDIVFNDLSELLLFSRKTGFWQTLDPRIMLQRRTTFWSIAWGENVIGNIRGDSRDLDAFAGGISALNRLEEELGGMSSMFLRRAVSTMVLSQLVLNTKVKMLTVGGRVGSADYLFPEKLDKATKSVQRFAATSTIGDLNDDPTMLDNFVGSAQFPNLINLMAEERATLLTILLQRHRVNHGQFPESVMHLEGDDVLLPTILTDPWSGGPFFFAPAGLKRPVRLDLESDVYRMDAGQPFLFSSGRSATSIYHYAHDKPDGESLAVSVATFPPHLILFMGLEERMPRFPLHNRVLKINLIKKTSSGSVEATQGQIGRVETLMQRPTGSIRE